MKPAWLVIFPFAAAIGIAPVLSTHAAPPAPPLHSKPALPLEAVPWTERTRPRSARPAPAPSGPLLTLDQFIGQRQQQIHRLNQVVLDKFQRLLRVTAPDDTNRADLHYRIAELYAEQQRHHRFLTRAMDQPIFEASGARRAALQEEQRQHARQEAAWKIKAVESYLQPRSPPTPTSPGRWSRSLATASSGRPSGTSGRRTSGPAPAPCCRPPSRCPPTLAAPNACTTPPT